MSKLVLLAVASAALLLVQVKCDQQSIDSYDVGCYKEISKTFARWGSIAASRKLYPDCLDGGIFSSVQCIFRQCFCAYYDTGKMINEFADPFERYSNLVAGCPLKTQTERDGCTLPKLHYNCNVTETKWKYNSKTKKCEEFGFGCYGFQTRQSCYKQCVPKNYDECSFPVSEGFSCRFGITEPRYRYNPETRNCDAFLFRGCGGNTNNYMASWQCSKSCAPQENVDFQIEVEYTKLYNVTAKTWALVKHDLNENAVNNVSQRKWKKIKLDLEASELVRDDTEESIDRSFYIGPRPGPNTDKGIIDHDKYNLTENCYTKPFTGPCRALFTRWFFNPRKSMCEKFIYGGCLAKPNNYVTLEECTKYCDPKNRPSQPDINGPPKPGAGNDPDGQDPYLVDGAQVVYRLETIAPPQSPDPRNLLLSEGPSGEGST